MPILIGLLAIVIAYVVMDGDPAWVIALTPLAFIPRRRKSLDDLMEHPAKPPSGWRELFRVRRR